MISLRNSIIYRILEADLKVGPAIVRTTCLAEIWVSGSFRQINAKPTEEHSVPGNDGRYTLQDRSATITTNSYPATSINCNISGNVVVATTGSVTGEYSRTNLENYGFSISATGSQTYYARKWYNSVVMFSVY